MYELDAKLAVDMRKEMMHACRRAQARLDSLQAWEALLCRWRWRGDPANIDPLLCALVVYDADGRGSPWCLFVRKRWSHTCQQGMFRNNGEPMGTRGRANWHSELLFSELRGIWNLFPV